MLQVMEVQRGELQLIKEVTPASTLSPASSPASKGLIYMRLTSLCGIEKPPQVCLLCPWQQVSTKAVWCNVIRNK